MNSRNILVVLLTVVCVGLAVTVESNAGQLDELKVSYLDGGDEGGFWAAVEALGKSGAYPIVEEITGEHESPDGYVRVTFLHRTGVELPDNVFLFANVNHVLAEELLFEQIPGTRVFFKAIEVPAGVRFEYRIHENDPLTGIFAGAKYGTRMHLLGGDPDPFNRNKHVYPDGLGEGQDYMETWIELPGASSQPYVGDQGNPAGELTIGERVSSLTGHSYKVFSYLPPGYSPEREYPMMILFDGDSYFTHGGFQQTLENLFADGSIPPLVVLGLNAGMKDGATQRNDEFTCDPTFMEFMATELIPWFTSQHSVSADPSQRIIAGSSFGGLFSSYFAFHHPEIVTNVLSQSGSVHWGRDGDPIPYEWLIREFAFSGKRPLKFYMEVGVLEGEYAWFYADFPHQVLSHRHFKTVLEMKGYDLQYVEYGGGHEMLSWRGGIADGLKYLIGAEDSRSR